MTRDELIQIAKKSGKGLGYLVELLVAYDKGVEAEREECAIVCEQFYTESDAEFYRSEFASAIRARGQE